MQVEVFNEDRISSSEYGSMRTPHILIVINDKNQELVIPDMSYQRGRLDIEFNDTEEVGNNLCFNSDIAKQILTFVNEKLDTISKIIVVSRKGISRSVAIASALSKILTLRDDEIYTTGVPNTLVYLTLLGEYFIDPQAPKIYSAINFIRQLSANDELDILLYKEFIYRTEKRING